MRRAGHYVVLLLLVSACCWLPPPTAGSPGAATPPTVIPGEAELDELESHLSEGRHYADGPGAEYIATMVRPLIETRDSLGVRVTTAADAHQRVVIVVQFDDDATEGLADLDDAARQMYLDNILYEVRALVGPTADIGVGIRGSIFYGAITISRAGSVPVFDIGFSVASNELAGLLAPLAPIAPTVPAAPIVPPAPFEPPPPPAP